VSSIAYAIEQAVGNMPSICTKSLLFGGPVKGSKWGDDAGFQDARTPGWIPWLQAMERWTCGEERRMIGIPCSVAARITDI
jgi:hypothetical protein